MSEREPNPLIHFQDIMDQVRKQNNIGKIPNVLVSEPRIGFRNYDSELIEFAKRIGNRDVLCGNDLLKMEMDRNNGEKWNRRYLKYVSN